MTGGTLERLGSKGEGVGYVRVICRPGRAQFAQTRSDFCGGNFVLPKQVCIDIAYVSVALAESCPLGTSKPVLYFVCSRIHLPSLRLFIIRSRSNTEIRRAPESWPRIQVSLLHPGATAILRHRRL